MCQFYLSQTLICDFHYNFLNKKCGGNTKWLFTDIDILTNNTEINIVQEGFHIFKTYLIPKSINKNHSSLIK